MQINITMKYDVVILTDKRYTARQYPDEYSNNVVLEDKLVMDALAQRGLVVHRTNWDNPSFDWSSTKSLLFRTTWDYFDRFDEFEQWLKEVSEITSLINPKHLIYWNLDKHYLNDLKKKGVNIVSSYFIETGDDRTLQECIEHAGWNKAVLKPCISGAARHTYVVELGDTSRDGIFKKLIQNESMILQPFIESITTKGEVSHMVMGGKYTHSILKKAKTGDFRVQDDFGGSVHLYDAAEQEIAFAEKVMSSVSPVPLYGRVDVVWDNNHELAVSELEIIEPELWFRYSDRAATILAEAVDKHLAE